MAASEPGLNFALAARNGPSGTSMYISTPPSAAIADTLSITVSQDND
jgi:hypothetical protein